MTQIPSDIQARIVRVAQELFEQSGRQSFPTVDQVRRQARVDMNAASAVMREWRRAQTAQAAPIAAQVPDPIIQLHQQGLAAIWAKAQELANDSLRAAQTGWEAEREELEAIRQELAEAFEAQAAELEQARAGLAQATAEHETAMKLVKDELAVARTELAQAVSRADRAEARVSEIERRANDLHAELERAHQEVDQTRTAMTELTVTLRSREDKIVALDAEKQAEIKAVQDALERVRETTNQERERQTSELEKLRLDANQAREESARMQGELETLRTQNAALLAALKPVKPTTTRKGKKTQDSGGQNV
jgi:colicin import membrane protein